MWASVAASLSYPRSRARDKQPKIEMMKLKSKITIFPEEKKELLTENGVSTKRSCARIFGRQ